MICTILVVEDDNDISKLLTLYLENDNYKVITTVNGFEALTLLEQTKIDLVVLDIVMPEMDGYELTKKIREKYTMPIIILSGKNQDSDKILGLNIGADDYLTKPFNPLEVVARVNSNLRRFYHLNNVKQKDITDSKIIVGDLVLDSEKFILKKNEKEIILTPTEYKILALLMKKPGRVYTKVQIYESINGDYFESYDNTMMVHISKLREKIEDDPKNPKYLKTIRGLGYKIEKI